MKKHIPTASELRALLNEPITARTFFENADRYPFRPQSQGFELANAWWLAEAAYLAYVTNEGFVRRQLADAGLPNVEFFDETDDELLQVDTQCFVAHGDDFAIVSFRGTELNKLQDIITDARLRPEPFDGLGPVHGGFRRALDVVWDIDGQLGLGDHLDRIKAGRTVWFTGHSLGGGLAALAAARFGETANLYTYGAPRVGLRSFTRNVRLPAFRIVHNEDIIPLLPPRGLYWFHFDELYDHVGQVKYFDRAGAIHDREVRPLMRMIRGYLLMADPKQALDELVANLERNGAGDHAILYYARHTWNALVS
jgi:hypothetical protein